MRKFVLVTHRWMGIVSMVFLAILGLTGSLMMLPKHPRIVGQLHTAFRLGKPGVLLVNLFTIAGVLLVIGGLVLWWRKKLLTVETRKGSWRFLHDLHHVTGSIGALLLAALCLTGTGMWLTGGPPKEPASGRALTEPERAAAIAERRAAHRAWRRFHTGEDFNLAVQAVYFVGSLGFAVLGVSGLTMWWKPGRRRTDAADD